jgi:tetratricopeptide (TPR) repeat protein
MSLLIKALDKAEKAQAGLEKTGSKRNPAKQQPNVNLNVGEPALSLSMQNEDTQQFARDVASTHSRYDEVSSERAANVFHAKHEVKRESSNLLWIAGLGLLSFLLLGAYFYSQINQIGENAVPVKIVQNTAAQVPALPAVIVNTPVTDVPVAATQLPLSTSEKPQAENTQAIITPEKDLTIINLDQEKRLSKQIKTKKSVQIKDAFYEPIDTQSPVVSSIASSSASIKISKSATSSGIHPTLVAAYNAYNAGNDNEAQQLYKQVLQRDIRHVDALLGLGAIAERQNRMNDAASWYRKVLEVEPRNTVAQNGLNQASDDAQNNETQLKNLIAQSPNDANLQSSLGGLYAQAGAWPDAQQAYFEAFRLSPNADNALNLAVSLDQMGKSALALTYYQRALELTQNGSAVLDKTSLEARIAEIQSK